MNATEIEHLQNVFGGRVQQDVSLARYTAARLGGPAEVLLEARSADELAHAAQTCWGLSLPFVILGGGSNVLISSKGVRGVVVLNKARQVTFDLDADLPQVWAESGANFGALARLAARKGLAGLEWAAGIPGTLGGAVFGNAGAHGGDMASNLLLAMILHHPEGETARTETWPLTEMEYAYRTSRLKRQPRRPQPEHVILSALLRLQPGDPAAIETRLDELVAFRKRTQPPGASMGSMFKNPPGDYAGRLIEQAGLKGTQVGGAEISPVHGNFFINREQARPEDLYRLIRLAQETVKDRFGVDLELEIELFGDWEDQE